MDELRQKFEALGNIKPVIAACTFDESDNEYRSERLPEYSQGFINGAWYVFQNQQSQIEQLEKEKVELNNKIKSQIELLEGASKSNVYNYREKNIMKSQADDLEKILRGECE